MTAREKMVEMLNTEMQKKSHTAYTLSSMAIRNGLNICPRTINHYRSGRSFNIDNVEALLDLMGVEIEIKQPNKPKEQGE